MDQYNQQSHEPSVRNKTIIGLKFCIYDFHFITFVLLEIRL